MNKIIKRLSPRELKKLLMNIMLINDRMKEVEDLRFQVSRLDFILGGHLHGRTFWQKDSIGFNGQRVRKETFKAISSLINFEGIIETGTNLGATTGYLAALTEKPVYSCEVRPESFAMASEILIPHFNNISLYNLDSIKFLTELLPSLPTENMFFYLDAHWYDFLPLKDEIEIISCRCSAFVILIDDFQVIGDTGYGYDKYANGKELTIKYIRNTVLKHNLSVFFPSVPFSEETGARRGYAYLVKGEALRKKLETVASLKEYKL